jgi:hypothetical protein
MRNLSDSKKLKVRLAAIETMKRRRTQGLQVLAAIEAMVPRGEDVDGRACGIVSVLAAAARAGVSGKATARAIGHWRNCRVFWLWWRGKRNWEVRFERRVVEDLLSLPAGRIGSYLSAHKRRSEEESARATNSV